jgi:hypothetical protein
VGCGNSVAFKRKFLSRSARYSGLLNILEFFSISDLNNETLVTSLLNGATTWLGMEVSTINLPVFANAAAKAGIKRAVFGVAQHQNNTLGVGHNESALFKAEKIFAKEGILFTGVFHGPLVSGSEDSPYMIVPVNASRNDTGGRAGSSVPRGVLSRVLTELVHVPEAHGRLCSVLPGNAYAAAYLSALRSAGLARGSEVRKMFNGGLQRMARRTGHTDLLVLPDMDLSTVNSLLSAAANRTSQGVTRRSEDSDAEFQEILAVQEKLRQQADFEERVTARAKEILKDVYKELYSRMFCLSTSQAEFYEKNIEMATGLARKEVLEEISRSEANKVCKTRIKFELCQLLYCCLMGFLCL